MTNTFRDRLACAICAYLYPSWQPCVWDNPLDSSCEKMLVAADRALAFMSAETLDAWKRSQGHSRAYECHNLPRWIREAWGIELVKVEPKPFDISGNDANRQTRTF
jgi:hypothetical protein